MSNMTRQQLYDAMIKHDGSDFHGLPANQVQAIRQQLAKSINAGRGDFAVTSMVINNYDNAPAVSEALMSIDYDDGTNSFNGPSMLEHRDQFATLEQMGKDLVGERTKGLTTTAAIKRELEILEEGGISLLPSKHYDSDTKTYRGAPVAELHAALDAVMEPSLEISRRVSPNYYDDPSNVIDQLRADLEGHSGEHVGYDDVANFLVDLEASDNPREFLNSHGVDPNGYDVTAVTYKGHDPLNLSVDAKNLANDINNSAWEHAHGESKFQVVQHGADEFTAMYANNQFSAKELVGMGIDPASLTINFAAMASGEPVVGQPETPSFAPDVKHDSFTV